MDLEGITVLDFTHLLPGPYATQLLADAGATVIKIEPPGGDAARHMDMGADRPGTMFELVNRGKESLTLDLKADGIERVLGPLFASADAVIEQFRPGVAERLGIGEAAVREHAPGVVYCSITGYGQTGPWRDRVGHDLNYIGHAGVLDMTRPEPDAAPVIPGIQIADLAGGMTAAFSIVSALLSRELGTSDGEYIDVSMTEAAMSFGQVIAGSALFGGTPRPGETILSGGQPCYDIYEAGDGQYLTVAALEPQFWANLCEMLDQEELIDAHLSDDPATREAVREQLAETFAQRSREEWLDVFGDEPVMVGAVNTFEEAVESPQQQARGTVLGGEGDVPPRLDFPAAGDVSVSTAPAPGLGADNDAVMERVGVDAATREELREAGVFGD
jgi:alpha-methylacyl-CoA racemase